MYTHIQTCKLSNQVDEFYLTPFSPDAMMEYGGGTNLMMGTYLNVAWMMMKSLKINVLVGIILER